MQDVQCVSLAELYLLFSFEARDTNTKTKSADANQNIQSKVKK